MEAEGTSHPGFVSARIKVLDWLEMAVAEENFNDRNSLEAEAIWNCVRSHTRFQQMLDELDQ